MSTSTQQGHAPYVKWTGQAPDPEAGPQARLQQALLDLIGTEGPVQQGVLLKRYLEAAGVGLEAEQGARRAVLDALEDLEDDGEIVSRTERAGESFGRVYRTAASPVVLLRERGGRTPFEVPLSELAAAWDAAAAAGASGEEALLERVSAGFGFSFLVDNAQNRILDAGLRMPRGGAQSAEPAGAGEAAIPKAAQYLSMVDVLKPASGEVAAPAAEPGAKTETGRATSEPEAAPKPPPAPVAEGAIEREMLRDLLTEHLDELDLGLRLPRELGDWIEYVTAPGLQIRARAGRFRTEVTAWIDQGPGSAEENRAAAQFLATALEPLSLPDGARIESTPSPMYRGAGVTLVLAAGFDGADAAALEDIARQITEGARPFVDAVRDRAQFDAIPGASAPEKEPDRAPEAALPPEVAVIRQFVKEAEAMGARTIMDRMLTTLGAVLKPVINIRFGVEITDPSAQFSLLRQAAKSGELDDLGQDERSAIFTLTRYRNAWAHHDSINNLDVMRATDAAAILVKALAPKEVAAFQLLRFGVSAAQVWGNAGQIAAQRARSAE